MNTVTDYYVTRNGQLETKAVTFNNKATGIEKLQQKWDFCLRKQTRETSFDSGMVPETGNFHKKTQGLFPYEIMNWAITK